MTAQPRTARAFDSGFRTDTGRLFAVAILVMSAGALAIAHTAERGFGLEPCPLCLWQRVPYDVTVLLALGALAPGVKAWRAHLVALCGLAFAAGAGIAAYHFGVEQQWWRSAVCAGGIPDVQTIADLLAALSAPPPKACDALDWTVFGLSITAYNAVASATLAAFALIGAHRIRREGALRDRP